MGHLKHTAKNTIDKRTITKTKTFESMQFFKTILPGTVSCQYFNGVFTYKPHK